MPQTIKYSTSPVPNSIKKGNIAIGVIYPLDGNVFNLYLYNRVLSASEVTQNFNAQKRRFGF